MAALNDIYQVRWWISSAEQAAVMVRHYAVTIFSAVGPTDQEIATAFGATTIPAEIKAVLSAAATYRGVQVQRIWPLPPLVSAFSTTGTGIGTVAGDALPGQVSGIITFRTAFAGRKFRGRCYVPFPGEADNAALGVPIASYPTRLGTLGASMALFRAIPGATGTATLNPCLPTKVLVPGSNPKKFVLNGQFTLITSSLARDIWATQRRRGDYGRANISPI